MSFDPPLWFDRRQAGLALAERFGLASPCQPASLLLALPRGGVPVAAAMADRLQLPLRTWSVRKVADPADPEVAIGAVAAGPVAASGMAGRGMTGRGMTGGGMAAAGVVVWRDGVEASGQAAAARQLGWLQEQERELARRQRLFGDPEPGALRGRHLIVVDDGIATGMTVQAALRSLRQLQPASLTLAVPVVDRAVAIDLKRQLDRFEALAVVDDLLAVGLWFERFEQLTDPQVLELLQPFQRLPGLEGER
ncbi:phosphoribosyltransferase [Synechococcus sp. CBW1002]|uniref:phosphoribosyltransferase n=1 Tax=unclassified Synechococcus TaxID=2626047 RepID=UPI0018CED597|nr:MULTISPECIES: phosphoribosyltransferase family protein [unclassified Synechococcus]QPN60546.1 phosphoribosyltransferase [Synechococcus sp. CBW1002]QPN67741.1 phosphoribosyltransferase [Synechococcus sp. CBW1006]